MLIKFSKGILWLCFVQSFFCMGQVSLEDSVKEKLIRIKDLEVQDKYGESLLLSNMLLNQVEQSNDMHLKARVYGSLGITYSAIDEPEKGLEYFLKANTIFLKENDTVSLISNYNNIAIYHGRKKEYDKAKHYFLKSIEISKTSKTFENLAFPYYNLGFDALELGNYNQALKYLDEAEKYMLKTNDEPIMADVLFTKGEVYLKLQHIKKALNYIEKAEKLAKKVNYYHLLESIYQIKADYFFKNKNYKIALENTFKQINVLDSIKNLNNTKLIKQVEIKKALKEKNEKLELIKKEKKAQEIIIKQSKLFNYVLASFTGVLALLICLIFKKNKQFKNERDKANSLSKIKEEFYSEISHELRTPLYAVIEISNLLLRDYKNNENKEYLESLKFSGNHLLALINNVLELNKIEAGQLKIDSVEFNLKTLATNIIESLEYAVLNKSNTIRLDYDNSIVEVLKGDSLKIAQILINLISNAIKFTNNGEIVLSIKQEKNNNGIATIKFKVIDNGIGIPKQKQHQVFQEYFQKLNEKGTYQKGTGLGLTIVKRTINLMGSDIRFTSEENIGTTFYFSLDLKLVKENRLTKAGVIHIKKGLKKYNLNLLIVDDNKINLLITKKILEPYFSICDVVESGEMAIEKVKTTNYDCILMDLYMPKLNGYQTSDIIKAEKPEIGIIALTASNLDDVKRKINKSRLDGFVIKPFDLETLISKILYAVSASKKVKNVS